jgi:hypothetical protein
MRRADNLAAICEPIVYQCRIINFWQPYTPPRPVTGIDFYQYSKLCKNVYSGM